MHNQVPKAWYVGWSRGKRTASLDVGAERNEHLSSHVTEEAQGVLVLAQIKVILERARGEGVEQIMLSGSEPTLRRDLGAIIRNATKRGLAAGVRTDARRFTVPGYAQKMADSGLRYAEVVLYGPQLIHDVLGQDASFEQTREGIETLLEVGVEVVLRCPVVRGNAEHLGFLSLFAAERAQLAIVYAQDEPGVTQRDVEGLQPLDVPNETVSEALALAVERGVPAEAMGFSVDFGRTKTKGSSFEVRPIKPSLDRKINSLRGVPITTSMTGFRPPEMSRLDTSPRYPDTALLTLIVAGCDLNCIFCETPQGDAPPEVSSLKGVTDALSAMRKNTSGVYFTGGEPSSVPWLFDALGFAKSLRFERIQMQSHAGRASEPDYADRLVEAGLTAIDIPFYGPNAAIHEGITKTRGSFERTSKGLLNLRERGVEVCVHITLFQSNLASLKDVIVLWNTLMPTAGYIQTAGEVGQPGTYERVAPSPTSVGDAFMTALECVEPLFPLFITDLAPCHLPKEASRILRWRGAVEENSNCLVLPYSDWLMTFTDGAARSHGQACNRCERRALCDGLSLDALHVFGDSELKPF